MLRQADAVTHEMVEGRSARGAVIEASEVAVAHVVGDYQDDIRSVGHVVKTNRFCFIKNRQENLDAETRNRYRLRLREAVRDPSAPRALLASVRMTDFAKLSEVRTLTPFPYKDT